MCKDIKCYKSALQGKKMLRYKPATERCRKCVDIVLGAAKNGEAPIHGGSKMAVFLAVPVGSRQEDPKKD